MHEMTTLLTKYAADQKVPVADRRVLFTAQQGRFIPVSNVFDTLKALLKERGSSHLVVENIVICIVKFVSIWSSSQFFSQKYIFYTRLLDGKA